MTVSKERKDALILALDTFLLSEKNNINQNFQDKIEFMIMNLKAMGEK